MTEKKVSDQHHTTFDGIRHLDEAGNEFWQAHQLAKVLEYSEYRHFVPVIDRAKVACQQVSDHFEDVLGMVSIDSGAQRPVDVLVMQTSIKQIESELGNIDS